MNGLSSWKAGFALAFVLPIAGQAQWTGDAGQGTPVSVSLGTYSSPILARDAGEGILVGWNSDQSAYVQRLSSDGVALWGSDGRRLSGMGPWLTRVVSGGSDFFILAFQISPYALPGDDVPPLDYYDVRLKGVDTTGYTFWDNYATGITGDGSTYMRSFAGAGTDGAVVLWTQKPSLPTHCIHGQWFTSTGERLWGPNGISICDEASYGVSSEVAAANRYALIVWSNYTHPPGVLDPVYTLYAQLISQSGEPQWLANGVPVFVNNTGAGVSCTSVLGDGGGGWYVAFQLPVRDSVSTIETRVQRLAPTGTLQWEASGVAVGMQKEPGRRAELLPDHKGGVIVAGEWCQKLDSLGRRVWVDEGVQVCQGGKMEDIDFESDGHGGVVAAWSAETLAGGGTDIYIQHIDAYGMPRFGPTGVPVTLAEGNQRGPRLIMLKSGAVVAWKDCGYEGNVGRAIYAQLVELPHLAGRLTISLADSVGAEPIGDEAMVFLNNRLGHRVDSVQSDSDGAAVFESVVADTGYSYNVYRTTAGGERVFGDEFWGSRGGLAIGAGLTTLETFCRNLPSALNVRVTKEQTGEDVTGQAVAPGTPLRLSVDVANPRCSGAAQQRVNERVVLDRDRTAPYDTDLTDSEYRVVPAGTIRKFEFTFTPELAGEYYGVTGTITEVDSVPIYTHSGRWTSDPLVRVAKMPLAPLLIHPGDGDAGVEATPLLRWSKADQAVGFHLMVGRDSLFQDTFVDTSVVDTFITLPVLAPLSTYWWRVASIGLVGDGPFTPAWEFTTGEWLSADEVEIPREFNLEQNYPNPFNPSTRIRFAVPCRSQVQLTIYTVLGERVADLVNGEVEPGYPEARFDATGLASGVYLCVFRTEGFVQTRKLLVVQ